MFRRIIEFLGDRSGATAIEYGLIASLVGIMIISGARLIGTKLQGTFTNVSDNLT